MSVTAKEKLVKKAIAQLKKELPALIDRKTAVRYAGIKQKTFSNILSAGKGPTPIGNRRNQMFERNDYLCWLEKRLMNQN